MNHLFKTHVGRLRVIALLEGWSLLILLFIAVPVKYIMGIPEATQAIGLIHGILFLLFVSGTLIISFLQKWSIWTLFVVMMSSMVPFGTFYVDRKLLRRL